MRRGFQDLIAALDDLCLDVPDAPDFVAIFVARAIVDDVLPPSFLTHISSSGELFMITRAPAAETFNTR